MFLCRANVARFAGLLLAALILSPGALRAQRVQEDCVVPLDFSQTSASSAFFEVFVFDGKVPLRVNLKGPVTTRISESKGTIQTEIVAMELTGESPVLGTVTLIQSPTRPSLGTFPEGIGPQAEGYCGGLAFFDVFFEITVDDPTGGGPLQLHNPAPLRVSSLEIPTPVVHSRPFQLGQADGDAVDLVDDQGRPVGVITNVIHDVQPRRKIFKRGDANCDGCVDEDDAAFLLDWLLAGGSEPCCHDAADANDDGELSLTDANYILAYTSLGGPPPPAPGPTTCGPDPTLDALPEGFYDPDLCPVECPPDACFPPAGKDIMNSVLLHDIDIPGIGLCRANLTGPVHVERSDPYINADGLMCIDTKMTDMRLTGVDPVCGRIEITLDPCQDSLGQICEKVPGTCFPANSWFMVFIKVSLPDLGMCFYACEPAKMHCMIDRIPPTRCLYNLDVGESGVVPLYRGPCDITDCATQHPCFQDPRPTPEAFIIKAIHQPLPPQRCDCFPPAGDDVMATRLGHDIEIFGLGIQCSGFTGTMVVRRSDPYINADGVCCIDTEVIRLDMTGVCADGSTATIQLCPERPSKGFICAKQDDACFPALSCFDIYFIITVETPEGEAVSFKNCDPATMCCTIDALPPLGCPYELQNSPVELYQVVPGAVSPCRVLPRPNPAGVLQNARHVPEEVPEPCCPEYGPGEDVFESTLLHDIVIPGLGTGGADVLCAASLKGPVRVLRGQPYRDPDTGLCCVDVEMVSLDLRGNDPVCGEICITLDPRRPSRGRICQKVAGEDCFPANSCFEMFVRIELKDLGLVLVACEPAKMCCMIDQLPPFRCLYNLDIGEGIQVPLYEEIPGADVCADVGLANGPVPVAFINKAVHTPEPPCDCFPPAGEETVNSELAHRIRLPGLGADGGDLICDADMYGPVTITRSDPYVDPVTGRCCIDTEITAMELIGNDPVCGPVIIRLCPDRPSRGTICAKQDDECFPALSCFDVFVEIEIPDLGLVLKNCAPVRMCCMINEIPPYDCFYELDFSDVPLYKPEDCDQLPNPDINPVGFIEAARHILRKPCDCPEYGPGTDAMNSLMQHDVTIFGLEDKLCTTSLRGKVVVERGVPYEKTLADGTVVCCVSTRMVSLDLVGDDPVCGLIRVTLCPDRPSRGFICAKQPGQCFPANSCFDVFVEIHVMGMVLKNCLPATMCCMIDNLPPHGCIYRLDLTEIDLYNKGDCDNPDAVPVGKITEGLQHIPIPCSPLTVNCERDPATGQVRVTWQDDPDCPCEQVRITRTIRDSLGNVLETVELPVSRFPGNVLVENPHKVLVDNVNVLVDNVNVLVNNPNVLVDNPQCPPGFSGGSLVVEYCVECIGNNGVASDPVCCRIELPCPSPPCSDEDKTIIELDCRHDPATDQTVIQWAVANPECCESFEVTITRPDGTTETRPVNTTSLTLPGCQEGTICVRCIGIDGVPGPKKCCDVECPPCDEVESKITDLTCVVDQANNTVTLSWGVANPDCCLEFVVTAPDGTTIISGSTSVVLDCQNGSYCVQCRRVDGSLTPIDDACCDVSCGGPVCDCEFKDGIRCQTTKDGLVVRWNWVDPDCQCPGGLFIQTSTGITVAVPPALAATGGLIPIPCEELFPEGVGTICVVCVDAAGNICAKACCEFCCFDCAGPFERADCNGEDGGDISDVSTLLAYLFLGGTAPDCLAACNANGDATLDISDAGYHLTYLFLGGPAPKPPFGGDVEISRDTGDVNVGCTQPQRRPNSGEKPAVDVGDFPPIIGPVFKR